MPNAPGVYRFRDAGGAVLYVGRATQLRQRVGSYWRDLYDRGHLAPMVRAVASVEAVACDSVHEAAWLERNLHERALPPWNRTPGGQENPVYIRLDTRPRAPGLAMAHVPEPADGVLHFGPYLGGAKVRQAVAALHQVLPLAYTAAGSRGLHQDLARKHGVDQRHRAELAATLAAVLRREPAAVARVLDGLRARRDAATNDMAYELAGRLHGGLGAVEWITAPQRVTLPEPLDFDVSGWAGGVLVQFRVRAGRLSTWSQRPCPHAPAPNDPPAPAGWAPFAQRTAALAARLAGRS